LWDKEFHRFVRLLFSRPALEMMFAATEQHTIYETLATKKVESKVITSLLIFSTVRRLLLSDSPATSDNTCVMVAPWIS
jgi:hypothetical protein